MQRSLTFLVRPIVGARGFRNFREFLLTHRYFINFKFCLGAEKMPRHLSHNLCLLTNGKQSIAYVTSKRSLWFRWRQQYRRRYPDEFLDKSNSRGKGDYHMEYIPAPRITKADKTNDRKSLQRALDRRLYLLIYGSTYGAPGGKPVWHFPEKIYDSEETLRRCAESALKSVLGDLSHTYFVGNAPMAHMNIHPTDDVSEIPSYKRFFFKSQAFSTNKFNIEKCKDFVWVTKDELMEYFPGQAEHLNKMIIS